MELLLFGALIAMGATMGDAHAWGRLALFAGLGLVLGLSARGRSGRAWTAVSKASRGGAERT